MRKLLSIAREFEGRGFNNLYDFVERLKYLKDTAREGQAAVEVDRRRCEDNDRPCREGSRISGGHCAIL